MKDGLIIDPGTGHHGTVARGDLAIVVAKYPKPTWVVGSTELIVPEPEHYELEYRKIGVGGRAFRIWARLGKAAATDAILALIDATPETVALVEEVSL